MKKIRQIWQPYLLRPTIYMTFSRAAFGLFGALLLHYLLAPRVGRDLRGMMLLLFGLIFLLLTWLAWLRLDGVKLPKMLMFRLNPAKRPKGGDLIDYVDEEPGPGFDELDDAEQDLCLLIANGICALAAMLGTLLI